ncbi:Uncharacterized protein TCM_010431 [Theobroma cacao]|uniref:Uncharacterized protein n=1 Tax=Theobroma cacao TaxID=3641 RepID=A0A061E847_THECC|nr:Uncharacterized protein TCM_010431 [Theobroma cacao]
MQDGSPFGSFIVCRATLFREAWCSMVGSLQPHNRCGGMPDTPPPCGKMREEVLIAWKALQADWISLNSEGAYRKCFNQSTAGGVLRDSVGQGRGGYVMRLRKCPAYRA